MKISRRGITVSICVLGVLFVIALLGTPNLLRVRDVREFSYADGTAHAKLQAPLRSAAFVSDAEQSDSQRQIIQTASLDLLVENVRDVSTRIEAMAQASGGYVDSSNFVESSDGIRSGQMTVRVPAGHMPDIRDQIKHLATRVEDEGTEARDVTKEVVDSEARLRNFKSEEAQYLEIMKRSVTVKETVEVTDKLSDVRGEIEQLQAELKDLSLQVQMAAITINLRSEKAPAISHVNWRPMQQARAAWHDMLQGFANYTDAMIGLLFMVPVILIWLCTLALPLILVWRGHRWLKSRAAVRAS